MFNLSYYKPKNRTFLENLEKIGVEKPQNYVPIYQAFFDLNETNYNNISFNHRNHIVDIDQVHDTVNGETKHSHVFIKYSPVLDPIHYMMGKYNVKDPRIHNLPQLNSTDETCFPKMLDTNNSSYIDGFFTFLTSILLHNHGVFHGVDYYGSFMGIQKKFSVDVIEDLEHLDDCDFFHKHLNKLFAVDNPFEGQFFCNNSRNCKSRLFISEDAEPLELGEADIEVLDGGAAAPRDRDIDHVFSATATVTDPVEDITNVTGGGVPASPTDCVEISSEILAGGSGVLRTGEIWQQSRQISPDDDADDGSSLNYTTDGDLDLDGESGSDSGSETVYSTVDDSTSTGSGSCADVLASIYNFPVNMICMEKCTGTLDSIMRNLTEDEWRSALFQVVMILLIYQKSFYLTHNDLHTNNIMYAETDHKHIYYKFDGVSYKVPTYGRIYKIIDYGRAIYTFSGRLFCSDSFDFSGDAATQYNFPPYYNDRKPTIEPNYSFDLCRLGCSIYDFVFENENDAPRTDFERLILEWCTDDNGKNVMYKKNGEERYLDFKLYKMIARTVHNHTPYAQLKRAFFADAYKSVGAFDSSTSATGLYLNVDEVPCYA